MTQRILAIIEREMGKFLRSPALNFLALVLPLGQLVILGNSFGGKIQGPESPSWIRTGVLKRVGSERLCKPSKTMPIPFKRLAYLSEQEAASDVRAVRIQGVVIIPPAFSRRVYAENRPALGLVLDNTDQFVSSAITQSLSGLVTALNQSPVESRLPKQSQESGVRSQETTGKRA
jgi:ABC-2 type transport system permease protein